MNTLLDARINVLKTNNHGIRILNIPLSTLVYKYAKVNAPKRVVIPISNNAMIIDDGCNKKGLS
jgi:hypothetical protein